MADFMRITGIIQIIGGIILGLILGNMYGSWSVAFCIVVVLNGVLFIAISIMMESIQRMEDKIYQLSKAYFQNNPSEHSSPKALGNSRSSLSKMTHYKMGQTEE
jgi:uncharacterized protein YacL